MKNEGCLDVFLSDVWQPRWADLNHGDVVGAVTDRGRDWGSRRPLDHPHDLGLLQWGHSAAGRVWLNSARELFYTIY